MSSLATSLSPVLSTAINAVQEKIVKTQTTLATNINPDISSADSRVIVTLSSEIATWSTRTINLKTANNLVEITQSSLSSISSLLNQMMSLVNSAVSDPTNTSSYTATYNSLAQQIGSIASSSQVNGSTLLGTSPGITIYPALSSSISSDVAGYDFAALAASLTNADISTGSTSTIATLNEYIDQVAALQTSMTAYSGAINSVISAASGFSSGLTSYINNLQSIDSTALQGTLQSLNNQQSINYYLVSQMNAVVAAQLAIFR